MLPAGAQHGGSFEVMGTHVENPVGPPILRQCHNGGHLPGWKRQGPSQLAKWLEESLTDTTDALSHWHLGKKVYKDRVSSLVKDRAVRLLSVPEELFLLSITCKSQLFQIPPFHWVSKIGLCNGWPATHTFPLGTTQNHPHQASSLIQF